MIDSSALPYPFGGLAVSPDGSKLYVTGTSSSAGSVLAVIDTVSNTITNTLVLATQLHRVPGVPALTPDGEFLYIPVYTGRVTTYDNHVMMVKTATNTLDGHVIVGTQPVAVAIAHNAKRAYVSNLLDGTVSVIDITPK